MGGCAPSKMPTGDDATAQTSSATNSGGKKKNSRFSFSSSGSGSARGPGGAPASLNASQQRIRHLAVVDDTYEIVAGGRLLQVDSGPSERLEGDLEGARGILTREGVRTEIATDDGVTGLDVMRDVGSQTVTSSSGAGAGQTEGMSQAGRPRTFVPNFAPRIGGKSSAPLATIETASELGTPTPMEENKAFLRPYGVSLLPQPGKQRPLLPSTNGVLPTSRLAFTPRGPTFPSPSPVPSPLVVCAPSPQPLPDGPLKQPLKAIRPTGLTPRTPPTSLIPLKSGVSAGSAPPTDNVMISTATSLGSFSMRPLGGGGMGGGLPKPGSARSVLSGKEGLSGDSARASSSASSTPRSVVEGAGSAEKTTAGGDHKLNSVTNSQILVKPSIPVPGNRSIRQPLSAGAAPRGPLAAIRPVLPLYEPPAKPQRKSPQSQPGAPASVFPGPAVPSERDIPIRHNFSPNDYRRNPAQNEIVQPDMPLQRAPGQNMAKYSSDEFDTGSDGQEKADEDGIFSEREALAELPKSYRLKESVLDEMLGSLRDVKDIAAELLKLHESNEKVLHNGHRSEKKPIFPQQNGLTEMGFPLKKLKIDALLLPPDEMTLNNPVAVGELIQELQATIRVLYARAT